MKAGQNAAAITSNSDAIGALYPGKVDMASDKIAAAQMTIDQINAGGGSGSGSGSGDDNIPWQQLIRQEPVQACDVPVADYDQQTAALMGCSESNPMISNIKCWDNAMGIVAMQVDYFDGRTIMSGDPSLASAMHELSMEMNISNKYAVFVHASKTDTQFGYLKLETNRGLGFELECGVTRGPNPVEFTTPNYVTVNNATRWLLEGMDVAYGPEKVAVGINFWGMAESDAINNGNLHLCYVDGPVLPGPPDRDCATEN